MITKFFRIATPTFKSIIYSFSSVSKNKALNPSDYLVYFVLFSWVDTSALVHPKLKKCWKFFKSILFNN